ncbi:MAG: carboxylating nicotinate-nucleotide diphosphorylase [Desulfobacterales bacterium]|nr:carboxylating nicotinate-nucleotide diphosphorylase [Desulfobacterales bacterium]
MFSTITKRLIEIALEEDIGAGDITTDSIISQDEAGIGNIFAKEPLIVAGIDLARYVFFYLDKEINFKPACRDGDKIEKGDSIALLEGSLNTLLKGERTALNFLQRLSGIATLTRNYIKELGNNSTRIVDTRKTTPGWRALEKYAVRIGGAYNHRMGLYDGILIKDNHIACSGGIKKAVDMARKKAHHLLKIEVEVQNFDELHEALSVKADVIMLDNMNIEEIKKALEIIDHRAIVEVSGGIKKENISDLAETGIDIISIGALTHSAKAVDISMDITRHNICI